jgi:predicted nucleotidyltransferase
MSIPLRPDEIIRVLADSGFEFVLIGGVAAIAHGAETPTKDFDVAAPLTRENVSKLMTALGPYRPRFALTLDKRPVDRTPEELAQFNNLYLDTDLGRIDVLRIVEPVGAYSELAPRSVEFQLYGRPIRVISLDDLIDVKTSLARPKDKQVELELRAIRDRLRSGSGPPR